MIARTNEEGFLTQLCNGEAESLYDYLIAPEEWEALSALTLYDEHGFPNYQITDSPAGLPCGGKFVVESDKTGFLNALKMARLKACEHEMHAFIDAAIPPKTREAFEVKQLDLMSRERERALTPDETTAITSIQMFAPWKADVIQCFYDAAAAMLTAADADAVTAVAWDFDGDFGADGVIHPKPAITLAEVINI